MISSQDGATEEPNSADGSRLDTQEEESSVEEEQEDAEMKQSKAPKGSILSYFAVETDVIKKRKRVVEEDEDSKSLVKISKSDESVV